jgi:hypothetical protein
MIAHPNSKFEAVANNTKTSRSGRTIHVVSFLVDVDDGEQPLPVFGRAPAARLAPSPRPRSSMHVPSTAVGLIMTYIRPTSRQSFKHKAAQHIPFQPSTKGPKTFWCCRLDMSPLGVKAALLDFHRQLGLPTQTDQQQGCSSPTTTTRMQLMSC